MHLLLYVEIAPTVRFSYQNSILSEAKARFPHITVYDCDNHSEPLVVRYAVDLLTQAERAAVIFQVEEASEATPSEQANALSLTGLGNLRMLFEELMQSVSGRLVIENGSHPLLEKMLAPLPETARLQNLTDAEMIGKMTEFLV